MIINIDGGNGGGGGGYVLPIASASVLGGVKVGSGLTIDNAGILSTSGGSAAEDWAWYSIEEYNELSKNEKRALYEEIKALVESGETKIGFYSYTEDTDGYDNPILNYERYVFSHYQDGQIYFQGVFAYRNIEDGEDENGYFISKCLRLDETFMEWYNYDSIEGGSGESNYVIVDDLEDIDNPTEGLMASVRSYSSETSSNKIYISDIEAFSSDHGGIEGYLGHFLYTGSTPSDPNQSALYISGDQFYWNLENDGQWHTYTYDFDNTPVSIEYRTHNEPDGNAWIEYVPVTEGVTFDCENNVAETALTITVWTAGKTYTYRIEEWVENGNAVVFKWVDIAPSTSAETVALRDMFIDMIDRGVIPSILRDNHVFNYSGSNPQWINFEAVFGYNADWMMYISGEKVEEDGFDAVGVKYEQNQFVNTDYSQHTINITSGGTFDSPDQLGKFSEESHTDTIIFKMDGDYGVWSQAPIKYVYRTRSQDGDPFVYYWSVEIPVNGTLYRGVWHATENDWSNYTTDSWAAV